MLRAVQRAVVLPVAPPYHRLTHPYHPPCGAGGGAAGRQGRRPQSCGPQTRRRQSGAAAPPAWSAAHAHWAAQVAGQGGCRVTMNAPGRLHKPAQTDAAAQARCPDSTTHAQRSPPLRHPPPAWTAWRRRCAAQCQTGWPCAPRRQSLRGRGKGASGAQERVRVGHSGAGSGTARGGKSFCRPPAKVQQPPTDAHMPHTPAGKGWLSSLRTALKWRSCDALFHSSCRHTAGKGQG